MIVPIIDLEQRLRFTVCSLERGKIPSRSIGQHEKGPDASPCTSIRSERSYSTRGGVGMFLGKGVETFHLGVEVVLSDVPGVPRLCVVCTCVPV